MLFQGVVVATKLTAIKMAKNGSLYMNYRMAVGKDKWATLMLFGSIEALTEFPDKALIRAVVRPWKTENAAGFSTDVKSIEVWDRERKAWVPYIPRENVTAVKPVEA